MYPDVSLLSLATKSMIPAKSTTSQDAVHFLMRRSSMQTDPTLPLTTFSGSHNPGSSHSGRSTQRQMTSFLAEDVGLLLRETQSNAINRGLIKLTFLGCTNMSFFFGPKGQRSPRDRPGAEIMWTEH